MSCAWDVGFGPGKGSNHLFSHGFSALRKMTSTVKESESDPEEDQKGGQRLPRHTNLHSAPGKGIESDIFTRVFFVPYQDREETGKVRMRSGRQSPDNIKISHVQK